LQTQILDAESRYALYRRREVRLLLSWTINGHEKITPILADVGYEYKEINDLLEVPNSFSLLEELSQHLLFHKAIFDMQLACPRCGSSRAIHDSYFCPFCKNHELRRGSLVEHYACNYVDFLEDFARGGELVCPKCAKTLKLMGTDYRRIDSIFRCNSCRRDFSVPGISHLCIGCKSDFTYETAKLDPIYTYTFSEELRQEVMANCVVELPILNLLKENGFKVESPGTMKGDSGIDYPFDIIATKDNKTTVIMIATAAREVGQEVVVGLFAKIYDCKPDKPIIVAIPRLSAESMKLANLYRIQVFEGSGLEEIMKKLRPAL